MPAIVHLSPFIANAQALLLATYAANGSVRVHSGPMPLAIPANSISPPEWDNSVMASRVLADPAFTLTSDGVVQAIFTTQVTQQTLDFQSTTREVNWFSILSDQNNPLLGNIRRVLAIGNIALTDAAMVAPSLVAGPGVPFILNNFTYNVPLITPN